MGRGPARRVAATASAAGRPGDVAAHRRPPRGSASPHRLQTRRRPQGPAAAGHAVFEWRDDELQTDPAACRRRAQRGAHRHSRRPCAGGRHRGTAPMSGPERRWYSRGFTLVEVLVAVVIVAFGMGAVLPALTSAADNVSRMREKSFAEWVALNQLATARL